MKEIFSHIIAKANFNSSDQQDASEALTLIFQVLKHQQTNENISTTPFGFCTYTSRYRYTCTHVLCQNEDYSPSLLGTILTVSIPQTENVFSQFDMKEAVMSTLQDSECERSCPHCGNSDGNQKLEITDTRQFLILQLMIFNRHGRKSRKQCTPLQNLELKVGGVDKKYQLECIIEHIGDTVQIGHYVSYFKISDDIWYKANDTIITSKGTDQLPKQPYICIYKETAASAELP